MEAKDTVKPVPSHSESIWCPHCGEEFGIESKIADERELQAEISFKTGQAVGYQEGFSDGVTDGYEAGRSEVVEWVEEISECRRTTAKHRINYITISKKGWQVKKKEWGIEKGTD